jgi:hypothetical protein
LVTGNPSEVVTLFSYSDRILQTDEIACTRLAG